MNCEQARLHLADLAYGALGGEPRASVLEHVRGCAACVAELRDLEAVRRALDEAPEPAAVVDLPGLYRRAAERQRQQARRWRRAALAIGAAAAALLVVTLLRVELRWHDRELVIGWGTAPQRVVPRNDSAVAATLLGEVQVLRDLAHEIVHDVRLKDDAQREEIAKVEQRLLQRLNRVSAASEHQWTAARNDVRALYTAYFGVRSKGDVP